MLKSTSLASERKRPCKFSSIMEKNWTKKLLVGDNVEVRQFGEGLEGSWHPAVIITDKRLSRQVKYNELLCEDGITRLVESITVSAFVDGQFSPHWISKNYRGRIRPLPPLEIAHGQRLRYGLCVDAFVSDAWWEGVVFDREEDSDHRLLFFPDLGDQQMMNISHLRITHDWDEITGGWQARGYWLLLVLLEEFEQEEGSLPVSIRQIWYDVRSSNGFKSRISSWICGEKYLWKKFVMDAIKENISASNGQAFVGTEFVAGATLGNISRKRTKIDKGQQIFLSGLPSISSETTIGLPHSSENGGLEPFLTFPLKTNSVTLESRGNNLDMAITNTDCSSNKERLTCTLPFVSLDEPGSSEFQSGPTLQECCLFASTMNSTEEHREDGENLEATIQGASGRRASCSGVSSGSFKKELSSNSEHCSQELVDFLCGSEERNNLQTHSKVRPKAQSKEKTDLPSMGCMLKSNIKNGKVCNYCVPPSQKEFYSFPKACIWKEKGSGQGTVDGNEGKGSCLADAIDIDQSVKVHGRDQNVEVKDKTLCKEYAPSRASTIKWQPVSKTFLPRAEYCPQALSDYIFKFKSRNSDLKGLEDQKIEFGQIKSPFKEVELKAKMHLLAVGWRFECKPYYKDKKRLRTRYVSPKGKFYNSLPKACLALEEDGGGMVGNVIDDLGGRGRHSNCGYAQTLVTLSPKPNSITQEQTDDSILKVNFKLWEEQASSVIEIPVAHDDSRNEGVWVETMPQDASTYTLDMDTQLDSTIQVSSLTETLHKQPSLTKRRASCAFVGTEHIVKANYCPQAITEYIHGMRMQNMDRGALRVLQSKAKMHLSAVGWRFRYISKQGGLELRYISPEGKRFISLHKACQWMEKGGIVKTATERTSSVKISTEFQENSKLLDGFFSDLGFDRVHTRRIRQDRKKRKLTTPPITSPLHRQSEVCFHPHPDLIEKTKQDGSEVVDLCGERQRNVGTTQDGEKVIDFGDTKHKHALGHPKKEKGKASHFLHKHGVKPDRRYQTRMLCQRKSASLQGLTSGPGQHKARTILSWLIDRDVVLPRQQVIYFHKKAGCVKAEGRITYEGIKCKCCDKVYSLANFEVHAGSSNRHPAAHIFLKDGRSLLDCQWQSLQDLKQNQSSSHPYKRRKISHSQYKNDSICSVCHYGGTLVLCDYCPSSFHLSCINLKYLPEGKWFCPSCHCTICGQSGFNDDIDQFTDTTVLFCDQCEREYHVGCLKKRGVLRLDSCPQGDWFCGKQCAKIFKYLNRCLGRSNSIGSDGLSWTIVKSRKEESITDIETVTEWHSKLCVALGVLHECFVPIVDPHRKSDLVADVLFNKGSELNRLNFQGFYTMLLEKGDEIISVAVVRIYGKKVAEMPLVATRFQYRRQGMCRLLVNELEKMLSALGIERLILPGIPQLVETWTTSFGFTKMTSLERTNLLEFTFLNFPDTTMCQKILTKSITESKGSRGKPQKLKRNSNTDCDGYNIVPEAIKTGDPIQIIASDDLQKVEVGDGSHLADASNTLSSDYHGLDVALQETKHIEPSQTTEGIPRNIAEGEGGQSCISVGYLAAGDESADKKFKERNNDGINYDSFKYFYTRRRILANKNALAPPLGIAGIF